MLFDQDLVKWCYFSLNGELAGVVQEASTEHGYILQREWDWGESTTDPNGWISVHPIPGSTRIRKLTGRVDFLGIHDVDSGQVILDRLNKVRSELELAPYTAKDLNLDCKAHASSL